MIPISPPVISEPEPERAFVGRWTACRWASAAAARKPSEREPLFILLSSSGKIDLFEKVSLKGALSVR